jgi:hypothetical protein
MTMMGLFVAAAMLAAPSNAPLQFERQTIGDNSPYEAASAFDVDNDGDMDIMCGEYWYEGPEFTVAHKVCDILAASGYYDDFSNVPMDVNGDGWMDVVSGGWFGKKLSWRENPKDSTKEWTVHDIAETGNVERAVFHDMDGDGVLEIVPVTNTLYIFKLDRQGKKGLGTFTQVTVEGSTGGHGLGAGDVNGDGRPDVLLSGSWMEAPQDPYNTKGWIVHKEWDLKAASHPVLVHDVNKDGKNDIIVGEAHNYGLYWMEQGADEKGARTWTKHMIEEDRSQFHDLQLHDIDKDGELELVTGKRYHAHNGHDPGGNEPVGLYYYEINGGQFERITLDYGDAGKASGAGIHFWVEDVDKNGWPDIIAPGKEGLFLFKNMGRSK